MSHPAGAGSKRILLRILIIICVVFLLSLSVAAYLLKRGIFIDNLDVGGIAVSDISLIWKEKLELQVAEISVLKVEKSEKKTSNLNYVRRGILGAHYLAKIFSRFSIGRLSIGQNYFGADLRQESERVHVLTLNSDDLIFKSLLTFNRETLDIDITEARVNSFNSDFNGKLLLDGNNDRITGTLTAKINGSFPLTIDVNVNDEQLTFEGK